MTPETDDPQTGRAIPRDLDRGGVGRGLDRCLYVAGRQPAQRTPLPGAYGFFGEPRLHADPTAARRLVRAKPGSALAGLSDLPVRGRGPLTGYEREAFGPAWTDTTAIGGCTRNDVLRRDLQSLVFKAGSDRCAVQAGRLDDPYTARPIDFVYGGASEVDIDHGGPGQRLGERRGRLALRQTGRVRERPVRPTRGRCLRQSSKRRR